MTTIAECRFEIMTLAIITKEDHPFYGHIVEVEHSGSFGVGINFWDIKDQSIKPNMLSSFDLMILEERSPWERI